MYNLFKLFFNDLTLKILLLLNNGLHYVRKSFISHR